MNRRLFTAIFLILFGLSIFACNSPSEASFLSEESSNSPSRTPNQISQKTPTKTPLPKKPVAVITVEKLNIREGPGIWYPVVGSALKGEELFMLKDIENYQNQTWYSVVMPENSIAWIIGEEGYITEKLVTVTFSEYQAIERAYKKAEEFYKQTLITPTKISQSYATNIPKPTLIKASDFLCSNTRNYIGAWVMCKVPITYCEYHPEIYGQPTFCNDAPYPNHKFVFVRWGSDFSNYDGKCVLVSGIVKTYNGKLEIRVENSSQILNCN
jgi:hypothetical protein